MNPQPYQQFGAREEGAIKQLGGYWNPDIGVYLRNQPDGTSEWYNPTSGKWEVAVNTQAEQTQPNPLTSGDGGGGTAYVPDIRVFKGINYDLNNPDDRNAFIQVQSAEVDKQLKTALDSGMLGYAAKLLDYKRSWEAQGQTLQEGYNQGMTARQQAFQGKGTRAYQSAMGTSGQNALNKLGEAQNERNYQKNQFNSGLETAYNDWISGARENAQSQKDTLSTNVANIGDFNPTSVSNAQTDLSAYTPYTNFQQFQSSPMATQGVASKAPAQQMTLSEWLGQQTGSQADSLKKYLMGNA
jgi:hypothetical protein